MSEQALSLFQFGGLESTDRIQTSVFTSGATTRKLKDGSIIENGTLWKPQKQADIKKNLNLTRKDQKQELDQQTAEAKNAMYLKFRAMILNSDPSKIGLERLSLKKDAKGLWTINFTGKEITDAMRVGVITAEKIAKAFGITVEEAEIKLGIRKAPATDVTEVKDPATAKAEEEMLGGVAVPAAELTQEEKDALELARMEAEENHKVAAQNAELAETK